MWGLNWAKSHGGEGRKGTCVSVLVCVSLLCADPLLHHRLWLYVGFDDCLPVDNTHELMPEMQLAVDKKALERSV